MYYESDDESSTPYTKKNIKLPVEKPNPLFSWNIAQSIFHFLLPHFIGMLSLIYFAFRLNDSPGSQLPVIKLSKWLVHKYLIICFASELGWSIRWNVGHVYWMKHKINIIFSILKLKSRHGIALKTSGLF